MSGLSQRLENLIIKERESIDDVEISSNLNDDSVDAIKNQVLESECKRKSYIDNFDSVGLEGSIERTEKRQYDIIQEKSFYSIPCLTDVEEYQTEYMQDWKKLDDSGYGPCPTIEVKDEDYESKFSLWENKISIEDLKKCFVENGFTSVREVLKKLKLEFLPESLKHEYQKIMYGWVPTRKEIRSNIVVDSNYDDVEDVSNFDRYVEAMYENRFSSDLVSDVGLPGHLYGYRDSCKQYRVVGCLEHGNHKDGGFYNKKTEFSCNTKHCNKCFPDWIIGGAIKVTNRQVAGILLRNNGLLHNRKRKRLISHVMVSPPKELHAKYADKAQRKELRDWAYSKLQEVCIGKNGSSNLDGSIMFDHGYRFNRDVNGNIVSADFEPHFHFMIMGWVDISTTNKMHNNDMSPGGAGWIVKYISNRKDKAGIFGLAKYLLSHSSVFLDDVTGFDNHTSDPTVSYVRDGMLSLFGSSDKLDTKRGVNSNRSGSSEHSYRLYGALSYNKLNVAVESQYRKDIAILELTNKYHNADSVNAVVSSINDDDIRDTTYDRLMGAARNSKLSSRDVDRLLYKSYMKRDYPVIPQSTFSGPCPEFDPNNAIASDKVLNEVNAGLRLIDDKKQEEKIKYIQVKYDRNIQRSKFVEVRKNRNVWHEVNGKMLVKPVGYVHYNDKDGKRKVRYVAEIDRQAVRWPKLDDVSGRPVLSRSGAMLYSALWTKKRYHLSALIVNSRYLMLILDTSKDQLCPECQSKMITVCWDGKDPPPPSWLNSLDLDATVKVPYNPQICYYRDVITSMLGYPYLKKKSVDPCYSLTPIGLLKFNYAVEFSYDSGIYSMPDKLPNSTILQSRIKRNVSYQTAKYELKIRGIDHITKDMILDFMQSKNNSARVVSLFDGGY